MPVYLLQTPDGEMLVEAKTKNSAVNYVAGKLIKAENLNTGQLVRCLREGMTVDTVPDKEEAVVGEKA